MSDSIRYEAIAAISKALESTIINEGSHREHLEQSIGILHSGVRPLVGERVQSADKPKSKKSPAKPKKTSTKLKDEDDLGLETGETVDPFAEEAAGFLKAESKPNYKQLQTKFKIGEDRAKKLFDYLVEKGDVVPYKKSTTKSGKKKTASVSELIADLPEGSNVLLKSPFDLLRVLAPKERGVYLAGLTLEDMVDTEKLGEAVKDGADTGLVDQIVRLSSKTRPSPKPEAIIDWKQYEKKVIGWTAMIPNGGDLFNHMGEKGLTRKVLGHFKRIAEAVENEEV